MGVSVSVRVSQCGCKCESQCGCECECECASQCHCERLLCVTLMFICTNLPIVSLQYFHKIFAAVMLIWTAD